MGADFLIEPVVIGQRGMGLNQKRDRVRLDILEENFYCEGGETMEQVVQRSFRFLIHGNIQG